MTTTATGRAGQIAENAAFVLDGYFAAWNETDPQKRRATITSTWTDDCGYVSPRANAIGHDELIAAVAAVQRRFPAHLRRRVGPVDVHHDRMRWGWELIDPADGATAGTGVDFGIVAADGRLREVTSFVDDVARPDPGRQVA
jgi:hypothetical protein